MLNLTQKKNKSRKNSDKDGKVLQKLMNNVVYGKTMENFRNRIDVRQVSNKKDYLKWKAKPSYMSKKPLTMILLLYVKVKVH